MASATSTRAQIVDKALELMFQRGLNGFSYRDIAEPLGIKNAAVHYHFPSKMDLIGALIEENSRTLRANTSEFMAYGGPARPQLEGLFRFTVNQCKAGRPICMVGALSIDYDELPDDIKDANDRFMRDTRNWMTRVLEVGRLQGEFRFDGDAHLKAVSILATIQGARQLARVNGLDILEDMFGQIRSELGIRD